MARDKLLDGGAVGRVVEHLGGDEHRREQKHAPRRRHQRQPLAALHRPFEVDQRDDRTRRVDVGHLEHRPAEAAHLAQARDRVAQVMEARVGLRWRQLSRHVGDERVLCAARRHRVVQVLLEDHRDAHHRLRLVEHQRLCHDQLVRGTNRKGKTQETCRTPLANLAEGRGVSTARRRHLLGVAMSPDVLKMRRRRR